MIVQSGQVNTNALSVPGLIVQIVPPSWTLLNGVPTNILGIVGTATWGPVNSPAVASGVSDASAQFGAMQPRKYDLGTVVAAAASQGGAASLRLVRVTDGTDVAASVVIKEAGVGTATVAAGGTGFVVSDTVTLPGGAVLRVLTESGGVIETVSVVTPGSYSTPPTNPVAQASTSGSGTGATFNLTFPTGLTLTGFYTGSLGNSLQAIVGPGSNSTTANPTFKLVFALPGQVPEVFDNIGGTGNALYVNMATAVNSGQNGLRGPSQLFVAGAGSATGTPAAQSYTASGGTDGATSITSDTLIGVDTVPRSGMYALRSTKSSVGILADLDDTTQWTTQAAFGLSEGVYMIAVSPAGDTITNFATTVANAGVDSYAIKLLFGDWCYINDAVNGVQRLISPQGFIGGLLANQAPNQSSLNKELFGIIGTQTSYANQQYSQAELQALAQARGDVIANPCPGGSYYGAQFGRNSSSNAVIHGDNYTRMTNYIAATLNAGMGIYVGQDITPTLMQQVQATLNAFFTNMAQPSLAFPNGMIDDWQVVCTPANNPSSRTDLGYLQADVQVQYQAILEYLIVNLQGGQSVQITRSATQPAS
ncbi:MAG: hypothetical protein WAL34_04005 [Acidobacteriaceae bacterium]